MSKRPPSQNHDRRSSSTEDESFKRFAFAIDSMKTTVGGAYYDPSNGVLYIMEDATDSSSKFEIVVMLLEQITPEVILLSSASQEGLLSCIQNAETVGGIKNKPRVLKRPPRDYNASEGFSNLKMLSVRINEGIERAQERISFGSTSTLAAPEAHANVRAFSENSNLTASALVNSEASHCSLGAVAALLSYLQSGIARDDGIHSRLCVSKVEMIKTEKFMHLGIDALQSLQIFDQETHANLHFSRMKEGLSLYGILNDSNSHSGKLLLKNWLLRPSTEVDVIASRADAIECFLESQNADYMGKMRNNLKSLGNIKRTTTIISSGKSRVGEWRSLINFIQACQAIYEDFSKLKLSIDTPLFLKMKGRTRLGADLDPLISKIDETIDWSQSKLNAGRVTVRSGADEELDDYREQYSLMESQLCTLAQRIRNEAPFKNLPGFSINYFPQIGYLCAIPTPSEIGSVDPSTQDDWEFQFSTETEEHYKNKLMRELDSHFGDLSTAIDDREIELVHVLEEEIINVTSILTTLDDDLAELDCLLALAKVTFERNWVRPNIVAQNTIQIVGGRHPLVESCVESYIPNDTHLTASIASQSQKNKPITAEVYTGNPMMVLTGANFSGKSVYLKQVAIIVILAQLGSFVPAEQADIGIHDAVFTRVSTIESASRSSSAFMIDLQRISFMLRNCTPRSLLLIDEFGKGTDPTDAQALFCGVIEHLITRGPNCPLTLVSTHFHAVFTNGLLSRDLLIDYAHMKIVLHPESESSAEDIPPTYLHKIAPGLVSSSHAMGCAAQAGVPKHIRLKADRVSLQLSRFEMLELLDVQLDAEEREELSRMEEISRRFIGIQFDDALLDTDWMKYLREEVLDET